MGTIALPGICTGGLPDISEQSKGALRFATYINTVAANIAATSTIGFCPRNLNAVGFAIILGLESSRIRQAGRNRIPRDGTGFVRSIPEWVAKAVYPIGASGEHIVAVSGVVEEPFVQVGESGDAGGPGGDSRNLHKRTGLRRVCAVDVKGVVNPGDILLPLEKYGPVTWEKLKENTGGGITGGDFFILAVYEADSIAVRRGAGAEGGSNVQIGIAGQARGNGLEGRTGKTCGPFKGIGIRRWEEGRVQYERVIPGHPNGARNGVCGMNAILRHDGEIEGEVDTDFFGGTAFQAAIERADAIAVARAKL